MRVPWLTTAGAWGGALRPLAGGRAEVVWHTDAIRTTLDIDDELMATLLARLPGRSKTEAIEHAVGSFLASHAVERLSSLAGTMEIEDVSAEQRAIDRAV